MKTLSQILRIAQQFHAHHNTASPNYAESDFLCNAVQRACDAGRLNVAERDAGKAFGDKLARSVDQYSHSLAGAVSMVITPNVDFSYARQLAAQVWEFIITELEIKEKEQPMTKIRHYRNMDYNPCLDQFAPHNLGGATIVYRELAGDKIEVGVSLCIENFNRSTGERIARKRLNEQPVVVDASELDGIFNMENLYYSNFATELEVSYKAKGVHLSFYKAYSAQF